MKQMRIVNINDGEIANPGLVREYGLEQLCSNGKYNFVGYINKNNNMLVSCPKHYRYVNPSDIKLIVRCIVKSFRKADKGSRENIDCNIPLRPYLQVLDYYYKHGIFNNISSCYVQGYGGNIDWNRTIRRSQKVVSGGNLLFLPFEIKKIKAETNFISECMVYAINDGYEQFGQYAGIGTKLDTDGYAFNFNNTEAVIRQLKAEEGKYFKDIELQLIRALIAYFSWQGSITEQSYFLTQSFDLSWENMVHNYLNHNFSGYDFKNEKIIFENECEKYVFVKDSDSVETNEKRNHGFRIEFDHISRNNKDDKIFLFDSKYYNRISEVNYKQIAYHYFLMNSANGCKTEAKNIVNGLILPTETGYKSVVHVDRSNIDGIYIQEHYLNIREVMEKYIQ